MRAETSLEKFLNKPVIDVLKILGSETMHPKNLSELIIQSINVHAILQETKTRNIIIRIMRKSEAEDFAKFIGIKEWDDVYYKLTHSKFTKFRIKKSLSFFGHEFDEELTYTKISREEIAPDRFLFPHQINTVEKIRSELAKPPHRALLHMPTGSGKTISAMRVVLIHLLENPSALVIWLAYNEELCEQALTEFQRMWKVAGDRKINTYRFFGLKNKMNPLEIDNGFVSASLSKMLGSSKKSNQFLSKLAQKTSLVIMDEAHQATAEKFSIIVEELVQNKGTKLLGLSATPGRKSDSSDSENRRLASFFAHRKVILDTGKENPVTFLMDREYLATPKFNQITYNGNNLSNTEIKQLEQAIDIPEHILVKLSVDTKRNVGIVNEIIRLKKTHKKIIVFASSVEHAKTISLILSAKKYNSYHINDKTSKGIRANLLKRYRNTDESMILCNYGILTTGFDAPKTSAVVIARPTKSSILYAQMVGRGIRGLKAGGNKTCEISTIIDDNIKDFIRIEKIFTQWETAWNE